jgi:hypothetical protein
MDRSSFNLESLGVSQAVLLGIAAAVFLLFLIAAVLLLLTQVYILRNVSEKNRRLPPGQVWLQLIPLFGLGWQFVVVKALSESLALELGEQKPAYGIGLAAAILEICAVVPFLGVIAILPAFICWIIYWIKLAEYRRRLAAAGSRSLA